jgi:hypothetical protein
MRAASNAKPSFLAKFDSTVCLSVFRRPPNLFHSLLSKTRQSHTLEAATKELPLRSKQAFTMSTSARRRLLRDFKRFV